MRSMSIRTGMVIQAAWAAVALILLSVAMVLPWTKFTCRSTIPGSAGADAGVPASCSEARLYQAVEARAYDVCAVRILEGATADCGTFVSERKDCDTYPNFASIQGPQWSSTSGEAAMGCLMVAIMLGVWMALLALRNARKQYVAFTVRSKYHKPLMHISTYMAAVGLIEFGFVLAAVIVQPRNDFYSDSFEEFWRRGRCSPGIFGQFNLSFDKSKEAGWTVAIVALPFIVLQIVAALLCEFVCIDGPDAPRSERQRLYSPTAASPSAKAEYVPQGKGQARREAVEDDQVAGEEGAPLALDDEEDLDLGLAPDPYRTDRQAGVRRSNVGDPIGHDGVFAAGGSSYHLPRSKSRAANRLSTRASTEARMPTRASTEARMPTRASTEARMIDASASRGNVRFTGDAPDAPTPPRLSPDQTGRVGQPMSGRVVRRIDTAQ